MRRILDREGAARFWLPTLGAIGVGAALVATLFERRRAIAAEQNLATKKDLDRLEALLQNADQRIDEIAVDSTARRVRVAHVTQASLASYGLGLGLGLG